MKKIKLLEGKVSMLQQLLDGRVLDIAVVNREIERVRELLNDLIKHLGLVPVYQAPKKSKWGFMKAIKPRRRKNDKGK